MRRSLDLLQFHLLGASVAAPAAGLLVWYVAFLTWSGQLLNPVNLVGVPAVMASGAIGGVVLYHLAWRVLLWTREYRGQQVVVGCRVRILGGPRAGQTAQVHESFDSRGEVRVELGEEAERSIDDVYLSFQVRRVEE